MRAVVYRGANDLRVETVPVPRIGSRELLVKVAACGVCPTDIKKIQYGTVPPPRIFGHETAGAVVKIGGNNSSLVTQNWRPRSLASSRAVHGLSLLPSPRVRTMRPIQTNRIILVDPVFQILWKQSALPAIRALNEALHPILQQLGISTVRIT